MIRPQEISIEEKVRFLQHPAAYGQPGTAEVLVKETHMSWVFLTGARVYKLKKPVRYDFLDFSTLDARERNCREEVRLNRRLAENVYLGVLPLTLSSKGELAIGGEGPSVDWLVLMRRLPLDRMLDQAIERSTVSRAEIISVADRLSDFYGLAPPAELTPEAYVEQFIREQAQTRAVLTDRTFDLDGARIGKILGGIEDILFAQSELLKARVEGGRIIEGHGDLRPEHVCLNTPPVIIDCLEFNRGFRLVDPADELTFLGLECEHLGAGWIGPALLNRYTERLGDTPSARLIAFYRSHRACLRARLSLVHILEHDPRKPEHWLPLARHYLELADTTELNPGFPESH
ncbi:MAG: hypothetical protein ACOY15_12230 [Pseudomonadota bacterium]